MNSEVVHTSSQAVDDVAPDAPALGTPVNAGGKWTVPFTVAPDQPGRTTKNAHFLATLFEQGEDGLMFDPTVGKSPDEILAKYGSKVQHKPLTPDQVGSTFDMGADVESYDVFTAFCGWTDDGQS